jgi:hypothetical protein
MNQVLITIAIPIVKYEYLDTCINSAVNQQYKNIEIILLNNAATNSMKKNIREICLKFKDKRIRYYENESQFPPIENWNKCLGLAKGILFSILSDDDYYESDFLTELSSLYFNNMGIDVFRSRCRIVNDNDDVIDYTSISPIFESIVDFIWHRLKGFRSQFLSEFLIKKETLLDIGGFVPFKNAWGSDDATWINLISKKGIIASSPKILCNYRYSNISITSITDPSPKLMAISQFNEWFLNFYSNNYINLLSYSDKHMIESIPFLFENRINKRKRDALSNSKSALFIISYWFNNRKKFTLTLSDLLYSLAKYFYNKKAITKY